MRPREAKIGEMADLVTKSDIVQIIPGSGRGDSFTLVTYQRDEWTRFNKDKRQGSGDPVLKMIEGCNRFSQVMKLEYGQRERLMRIMDHCGLVYLKSAGGGIWYERDIE